MAQRQVAQSCYSRTVYVAIHHGVTCGHVACCSVDGEERPPTRHTQKLPEPLFIPSKIYLHRQVWQSRVSAQAYPVLDLVPDNWECCTQAVRGGIPTVRHCNGERPLEGAGPLPQLNDAET